MNRIFLFLIINMATLISLNAKPRIYLVEIADDYDKNSTNTYAEKSDIEIINPSKVSIKTDNHSYYIPMKKKRRSAKISKDVIEQVTKDAFMKLGEDTKEKLKTFGKNIKDKWEQMGKNAKDAFKDAKEKIKGAFASHNDGKIEDSDTNRNDNEGSDNDHPGYNYRYKYRYVHRSYSKGLSCPAINTNTQNRQESERIKNIGSMEECSSNCQKKSTCNFWMWAFAGLWGFDCILMSDYEYTISDHNTISGDKNCSPADCLELHTDYFSNDIVPFYQSPREASWQKCRELCRSKYAECQFWTLTEGICLVKTSKDGKRKEYGAISGSRECGYNIEESGKKIGTPKEPDCKSDGSKITTKCNCDGIICPVERYCIGGLCSKHSPTAADCNSNGIKITIKCNCDGVSCPVGRYCIDGVCSKNGTTISSKDSSESASLSGENSSGSDTGSGEDSSVSASGLGEYSSGSGTTISSKDSSESASLSGEKSSGSATGSGEDSSGAASGLGEYSSGSGTTISSKDSSESASLSGEKSSGSATGSGEDSSGSASGLGEYSSGSAKPELQICEDFATPPASGCKCNKDNVTICHAPKICLSGFCRTTIDYNILKNMKKGV